MAAGSSAGDESSSLFSFFFYVLFVYPAANWILKPGRFSKSRGLAYAIAMLVAIAAVKTGFEIQERGPNFYRTLDVSRGSSALDIKRAYKRMSLELHPDKNPSATAVDDFAKLKDAYDVLMDTELKDVYNRFGEEGVKANKRVDEYRMLLEIAVFYVAWGIMAFLLTLGKASAAARQWIFTGQLAMFVAEVLLMLNELKLPDWFLPQTTEHELVLILHALFPAYVNGCRCIGGVLYVDLEEQTKQLLLALHEQNKDVLLALRDVHAAIAASVASGGGAHPMALAGGAAAPGSGGALSAGAEGPAPQRRRPGHGGPLGPGVPATPMQKLKDLEATLRGSPAAAPSAAAAHPALVKPEAKSNLGLYVMIAAYIAIYYCFSGSG
mmetsp:Transcript_11533/g.46672  ORF Transcript_11533/g.46672 Transcript_11533/m.46672 type:complete len:381 (-) Transcript_11533:309-1451(-)|eukprot:CAMPEP_0185692352 /NCGR_PEP_ID=MMETSP1164-20130828/2471_1 /TAXON_ID=1104430 /ORGANISM="Chrysoreinhardia sp, Strain CCMP2950" /LENGTH=380 /DNA_ID=CAMNT_0028359075 /DNA_START=127 /DNA_END=1269 /DNA_ORIENTATION=+